MAAGLSAVWRSHDLAVPRMANLYSPHSFVGMAAVCLLGVQVRVTAGDACLATPLVAEYVRWRQLMLVLASVCERMCACDHACAQRQAAVSVTPATGTAQLKCHLASPGGPFIG